MVIPGEKYRPAGGAQISEKCDGGHILRTIARPGCLGLVRFKSQRFAVSAVGDLHVESKCVKAGLPVACRGIARRIPGTEGWIAGGLARRRAGETPGFRQSAAGTCPPCRLAYAAFQDFDWAEPELMECCNLFLRAARVVNDRNLDVPKSLSRPATTSRAPSQKAGGIAGRTVTAEVDPAASAERRKQEYTADEFEREAMTAKDATLREFDGHVLRTRADNQQGRAGAVRQDERGR